MQINIYLFEDILTVPDHSLCSDEPEEVDQMVDMADFEPTKRPTSVKLSFPLVEMKSAEEKHQVVRCSSPCLEEEVAGSLQTTEKPTKFWQASNFSLKLMLRAVGQLLLWAVVPRGKKTLSHSTEVFQEGYLLEFAFDQLWSAAHKPKKHTNHGSSV